MIIDKLVVLAVLLDRTKLGQPPVVGDRRYVSNKCKKNCRFITMCKARSKVTHKTATNYVQHVKGREYNTQFLLYSRPLT